MDQNVRVVPSRYLTPGRADKEILVLTDKAGGAAILTSEHWIAALSAEAARIVKTSFMEGSPRKLPAIVRHDVPEDLDSAVDWIGEMVTDGFFRLAAAKPKIETRKPVRVRAGEVIPVRFGREGGVVVEYDGTLEQRVVGSSTVYWYTADVELPLSGPLLGLRYPAAAIGRGPVSAQMRISRVPGLGVNCTVCAACGVCAGCAGCALCGGVNFAAAALGVVGVDTTLFLVNAATTFEMLRTS